MEKGNLHDNVEAFIQQADLSGLVDEAALRNALVAVSSEPQVRGVNVSKLATLAAIAVERGLLTCWQCGKLRMGRHKGFFLDHFKLMDHLGHDAETSQYLVRDLQQGGWAVIAIQPHELGRSIKYEVIRRWT